MSEFWVIVADDHNVRCFEAESRIGALRELWGMQGLKRSRDGTGRPSERAGKSFARDVANRLEIESEQGNYKRLIIAAAPRFLSYLRAYMSHKVRETVAEELAEDLIDVDADRVRRSLPMRLGL